jgi:hypothetical protein
MADNDLQAASSKLPRTMDERRETSYKSQKPHNSQGKALAYFTPDFITLLENFSSEQGLVSREAIREKHN